MSSAHLPRMNSRRPPTSRPPSASASRTSISSYGANHVLKDVNLDIRPGEFFAFLGPSGCGKTTLLRLIAGFNQADTGTRPDRRRGHLGAAALEARRRHGVPVLCALAAHDGAPQRRLRTRGAPPAARGDRTARRGRARSRRARHIWQTGVRRSSPAASSSASRSPAPSRSSRRSCCSTSRCPISTPSCACKCGASCATCSSGSG